MDRTLPNASRSLALIAGIAGLMLLPNLAVGAVADDGAKDAPPARDATGGKPTGRDGAPPPPREGAPPRRERGAAPPDDMLRGPGVGADRGAEGAAGRPFSGDPSRRVGQRGQIQVPPRIWFAEFRRLELTDEVREQFTALLDGFSGERALFEEEHGPKIRELELAARAVRAEDGEENAAKVQTIREEITAIRDKAPKVEDVQKKAFELLDEEQQKTLRAQLTQVETRLRDQAERRRGRGAPDGMSGERPERPEGMEGAERPRRPAGTEGADRPRRPAGTEGADRPRRPAGTEGADRPGRPAGTEGADRPRRPAGTEGADRPGRPAGQDGTRE